jgi:hypothetical protein
LTLLLFPLVWRLCTVATISPKTSLLNITTDKWQICSLPQTNGDKHTVEVGSLHTLRLESLKLVFQPLHKFLVNNL